MGKNLSVKKPLTRKENLGVPDQKKKKSAQNSFLIAAASNESVGLLLAHGVTLNVADENGKTALWRASWRGGLLTIVKLFAETGADTDIADDRGRTPLAIAMEGGYSGVAKYLQEESNWRRRFS